MNLKDFKLLFFSELKNNYPETEIQSFYYILLQHQLHLSKIEAALDPLKIIKNKDVNYFKEVILQLKKQKPIQYIIGEVLFYSLIFKVNKHTLIPRPETEELVEWILYDYAQKPNATILDIGTGSGCIAISLAKNLLKSNILGIDICNNALQVAQQNAQLNNCNNVQFKQKDILKAEKLNSKFDIIVSNPPYVRDSEKKRMQKNVLHFEPKTALFVSDNNPLVFYKKIGKLAKENLTKNGALYFEINQYLKQEMQELLKNLGFTTVEVRKDMYGAYRMIKASF